jgi:hypothetical protein
MIVYFKVEVNAMWVMADRSAIDLLQGKAAHLEFSVFVE